LSGVGRTVIRHLDFRRTSPRIACPRRVTEGDWDWGLGLRLASLILRETNVGYWPVNQHSSPAKSLPTGAEAGLPTGAEAGLPSRAGSVSPRAGSVPRVQVRCPAGTRWLDASSGSVLDLAADDGHDHAGVPDRLGVGEEGLFGSVAEQFVRPMRGCLGVQPFGGAGVGVDDDEVGVHAGGQVASAVLEPGGERGSLRVQTDGFDGGQAALGLEARGR